MFISNSGRQLSRYFCSNLRSLCLMQYRTMCKQIDRNKKGLFGVELLTNPDGFKNLNQLVKQRSADFIEQILNNDGSRKTVELFDDLSNEICCSADLVECTRLMHSQNEFKVAAEESMRDFTEFIESLNTRTDLYNALKMSLELEKSNLTDIDRRTILLFLADFENSGVHLHDSKKQEFVELSTEIFDAGSKFVSEAGKPVQVNQFDRKKYGVDRLLTNPYPFTICEATRRWSYSTYYRHNEKQESSLRRLITARHRLANLTGYKTFADRAQEFSILGSYENAHNFLTEIIKCCRPSADRELTVLLDVLSQCDSQSEKLGEWDLQYLSAVYRQKAYGNIGAISRHLSFKNILFGFELVTKKLYGVRFSLETAEAGEIWPGNVHKLVVLDSSNSHIGTIYLDIEKRATKVTGDCHFTVRCSKLLQDGTYQKPIVVISLSIVDGQQSIDQIYLSTHQADNFFHEMGHAMHSMLGRTQYQHVAGTRCPTDMAEIPSNLMEYCFNDLSVLREIAKDSNGNSISVEEAASLITSRFAFTATEMLQQAIYALFDLEIHGHNAYGIVNGSYSSTDLFNSIWSVVFPNVVKGENCAWQHRFSHLFPYGAKYYSYMVAKAAACLIWNTRFRDDPFSSDAGKMWAKVQSYGGALPSADLLHIALGYWPTVQNLANAIKNEANNTCQFSAVNF